MNLVARVITRSVSLAATIGLAVFVVLGASWAWPRLDHRRQALRRDHGVREDS